MGKLFVSLILIGLFTAYGAVAADSYQLNNTVTLEITEHTACQSVANNSGKSLFIPTKTSNEWTSFRNSSNPAGVTRGACGGGGGGAQCFLYGDQTSCEAVVGCDWDNFAFPAECILNCYEIPDQTTCEANSECGWNGSSCGQACNPTCEQNFNQFACELCPNCDWNPIGSTCDPNM